MQALSGGLTLLRERDEHGVLVDVAVAHAFVDAVTECDASSDVMVAPASKPAFVTARVTASPMPVRRAALSAATKET